MQKLTIYQALAGQWNGKLLNAQGEVLVGLTGYSSPEDIEIALQAQGFEWHCVEFNPFEH